MNSTTTETGDGEAVATSLGSAGGGSSEDLDSYRITQEGIAAHLASGGKCWNDGKTTLEGIQLGEQVAKRHRLREYGETPMPFRFAAEIMAAWPDEPANI